MTIDTSNDDRLGPVDHVIVEFLPGHIPAEGFTRLLALVESGIVRILDLEFVTHVDGTASTVAPTEVGEQLAVFEGSSSGLLDGEDLRSVADRLKPGSIAAVLVLRNPADAGGRTGMGACRRHRRRRRTHRSLRSRGCASRHRADPLIRKAIR